MCIQVFKDESLNREYANIRNRKIVILYLFDIYVVYVWILLLFLVLYIKEILKFKITKLSLSKWGFDLRFVLYFYIFTVYTMELIIDGSSEHGAYIWSTSKIRFVEGIWLHQKSRQFGKDLFYFLFAQHVQSYHLR